MYFTALVFGFNLKCDSIGNLNNEKKELTVHLNVNSFGFHIANADIFLN